MNYTYPFAKWPKNRTLLREVNGAADRLHEKLSSFGVSAVPISEYSQKYFNQYQKNIHLVLQRTVFILTWSISLYEKQLSDLVFVDYGGGTGFLALLAKELGIGHVIYNDIYDVSCEDARLIADSLRIPADAYVCGDVDELIDYFMKEGVFCDVVASYDVLEHIYSVESFLSKLTTSSNGPSTICMASAANPRNPIIRRNLTKMHLIYEYQSRPKAFGHKERDTLRPFYAVRREAIENYAPELSEREVEILATNTRGKIIKDILASVDEYRETKTFPIRASHPTNTCDPHTGNWQEQLLELDLLMRILKERGVRSRIVRGYYGTNAHFLKNLMGLGLNLFISGFSGLGLGVAPFFILYGVKDRLIRKGDRSS
jgi:2-polyprenyl-3-methyl-5-hydroxy-6-metoxy-1,4-benzoquinol methylase